MGRQSTGNYRVRLYTDQSPVRGKEWYFTSAPMAIAEARDFATNGRNKHRWGTHTGRTVVAVEEADGRGEWASIEEFAITPIGKKR